MIFLAVDTTTFSGSVALLKGTELLGEVNIESSVTFSERLLPAVDFLLRAHGLTIEEMEGYALAVGPGSFTGIRIGLSTVKSFAYASGKPVAPVSTLKALALKLSHPRGRLICPLLDAKKGEIFAALFETGRGELREVVRQGAYKPDQFLSLLPAHRIIFFIGNGGEAYREKIVSYFQDRARFSPRSPFIAHEVGLLGYALLVKKKGLSAHQLEPLYFRKSQAEKND